MCVSGQKQEESHQVWCALLLLTSHPNAHCCSSRPCVLMPGLMLLTSRPRAHCCSSRLALIRIDAPHPSPSCVLLLLTPHPRAYVVGPRPSPSLVRIVAPRP